MWALSLSLDALELSDSQTESNRDQLLKQREQRTEARGACASRMAAVGERI